MPSERTPRILRGSRFTTKQGLLPYDFAGSRPLLPETGDDRPAMIAKIDSQREQFVGPCDFADRFDCAHADIHPIE